MSKVIKSSKPEVFNSYCGNNEQVSQKIVCAKAPEKPISRAEVSEIVQVEASKIVNKTINEHDDALKAKSNSVCEMNELPYHGTIAPYNTICVSVPTQFIRSYLLEIMDDRGDICHYCRSGMGPGEQSQYNAQILIQNKTESAREFILSWT